MRQKSRGQTPIHKQTTCLFSRDKHSALTSSAKSHSIPLGLSEAKINHRAVICLFCRKIKCGDPLFQKLSLVQNEFVIQIVVSVMGFPSYESFMMPSSNGSIFCVTGPLWKGPPVTSGFPSQRPVTLSNDVFFDLHLKRLGEQSRRRWLETPPRPYNVTVMLL